MADPLTSAIDVRRPICDDELAAALRLRTAVFCEEQGVSPAEEFDGRDDGALHLVALRGDDLIGTCRLLFAADRVRLGRLAVAQDARRRGVGAALLVAAERMAREAGGTTIVLHAQTRARSLYEGQGYVAIGDAFLQARIEHVTMEKALD